MTYREQIARVLCHASLTRQFAGFEWWKDEDIDSAVDGCFVNYLSTADVILAIPPTDAMVKAALKQFRDTRSLASDSLFTESYIDQAAMLRALTAALAAAREGK